MLHLLIDTSVLRQDPQRKSAAFQVVHRIGYVGELTTHIPQIVKLEFISYREDEYLAPLRNVEKDLGKLSNKPIPPELKEELDKQKVTIKDSLPRVQEWIEREFEIWCGDIGAELHGIATHHGVNVVGAYFSGTAPFKSPKNRADFPDAFIFECVCDVAKTVDVLNVVVADKQLREACSKLANVVTFESLDDFIKSEACHSVLKDAYVADNFEVIMNELKARADIVGMEASRKLINVLDGYTFRDPSIPDDNNEARISMLDVPPDAGLVWDGAEYYGSGIISIPFEFEMTVLADYYIFKSDWYCIDEKRATSISISEYGNKHYFEAEEEFNLSVKGAIAISLDLSEVAHDANLIESLPTILDAMQIETSEIDDVSVIQNELAEN